jgi:FtsP/CotA-like multicopper oxidase with cupredoxin domain
MLTRRRLITTAATLLASPPLRFAAAATPAPLDLTARQRALQLPTASAASPVWTYADTWPLVVRAPRGQVFRADLHNELAEHTTIHWHGIRLPMAMDGVPYMTQPPVEHGQSFAYEFTPPDAGTFFFHPHCDTVTQLGRGLAAALIIEDPAEQGLFAADLVCAIKDWQLNPDGSFGAFITDKGAARAGTFGNVETVNAQPLAELEAPAGGWVRLRVLNLDSSRIVVLDLAGAEGRIVATDGNPLPPIPVKGWRLGPAMRADIVFRMPEDPSADVMLNNVFSTAPRPLARIAAAGSAKSSPAMPELVATSVPEGDPAQAKRLSFDLTAGHVSPQLEAYLKETGLTIDALCLPGQTFWAINGQSWAGQNHQLIPPPLAELKLGQPYLFEIFNGTPHPHPIHLHGHTFRVLRSNKKDLIPHLADTVLVAPKERVEICFIADNPGDWMMHCHIIEHQETGMMGYFRVA